MSKKFLTSLALVFVMAFNVSAMEVDNTPQSDDVQEIDAFIKEYLEQPVMDESEDHTHESSEFIELDPDCTYEHEIKNVIGFEIFQPGEGMEDYYPKTATVYEIRITEYCGMKYPVDSFYIDPYLN